MGDPIASFLAASDHTDSYPRIPERRAICCCGNDACAFLKHNQTALDGLESDVLTAARLGKALLARHEAYIADSERERKTMAIQIETLEMEKRTLERRNAAAIQENRLLLDQLESVNNAEAESDIHLTNLQATLEATQQELTNLQGLAARTESLERQIADFEREQLSWHSTLESKEESEKNAVRRWQQAERTLAELQDQIERIEREAQEERQRHADVVERMERRYAVQRELDSAAGRLKGAAAVKSNDNNPGGSNVVSHFVKDILQDNANLQTGIVELREMLNTSNEEVEKLRNQLILHQSSEDNSEKTPKARRQDDLKTEMTRANSHELHVHHHYHAPPSNAPKPLRKKKRSFAPGHQTPPSGFATPRSSFSHGTSTSLAAILQQTSASVPQQIPEGKRWSTHSSQNNASLASSPQSATNQAPSLYERVFSDGGHESSRASTPDTEDFGSPGFGPSHFRKPSAGSSRAYGAPMTLRRGHGNHDVTPPTFDLVPGVDDLPRLDLQYNEYHTIPEENEADWENMSSHAIGDEDTLVLSPHKAAFDDMLGAKPQSPGRKLRRTASHESVLSVAAMDIHTLKTRPSQLLGSYGNRSITTDAVISDTNVHATRPIAVSRMSENSRMMLSGLALDTRQSSSKPTLGRKVGGWVFGKWGGATPTPDGQTDSASSASHVTTRSKDKAASISTASVKSGGDEASTPKKAVVRSPGINQTGPIFGFGPEIKIQHAPIVNQLDEDALRIALAHD